MKHLRKSVSVLLTIVMLSVFLPMFAVAAQSGAPEIEQDYLITAEDGRMQYWVDSDGNVVDYMSNDTLAKSSKSGIRFNMATDIPETYDARDDGVVTSVKYQGNYGTCWAFAATSCVETSLIKQEIADSSIDLSESHLVWFAKNNKTTDTTDLTYGDGESYTDAAAAFNAGGSWMDSASTYARGTGPVNESDYPYEATVLNESERYNAEYRVTDCMAIANNSSNTTKIKRNIMEYGSAKISYYSHTYYYNVTSANGSAYYYPDTAKTAASVETTETNHDVVVVGWDDNYSKENFMTGYQPSTDGAWLVKNSWGSTNYHMKDGYFWLSYEESEVADFTFYKAATKSTYDNTYQYDAYGSYTAMSVASGAPIYGANVFTAKGSETLNMVGFYTRAGVLYTISIYKLADAKSSPTSGTLVSETSGAALYYGYHTASLKTTVDVKKGDVFAAVIKIESSNADSAKLMCEGTFYYDSSIKDYESYISFDGSDWEMIESDSGYYKTTGNVCLKVMSVDKTGCVHNYTSVVTSSTCLEGGYTTYTCTLCGDTYTADQTDAKEHTPVTRKGKAATCTETGLTDGTYCSVCETVITPQQVIEKTEHTPLTVPAQAPTCTEDGYEAWSYCSVCKTVLLEKETIGKTGHTSAVLKGKAATCTETGLTDGTYCSICGTTLTAQQTIPMVSHSYGEAVTVKAATCTETGTAEKVCTECGDKQTVTLAKIAHTPETVKGTAPTCTKMGLTDGTYCSVCKQTLTAQQTIKATGHNYSTVNTVKEATCTEDGLIEKVCKCGDKQSVAVAKTGHKDANGDGICDSCGTQLEQKNPSSSCSCNCHKTGGIAAFFWKIKLFFIKIFKVQQDCKCGAKHYN